MKNLSEYISESLKIIDKTSRYDVVQVVDRSFKESISDSDFKKFIKKDIDECFKLDLKDSKEITRITVCLNPTISSYNMIKKYSDHLYSGEMAWNNKTLDTLLEIFHTFGIYKGDREIDLYNYVIGWTIDYTDYKSIPNQKVEAHLSLKINKEGEEILEKYLRGQADTINKYKMY